MTTIITDILIQTPDFYASAIRLKNLSSSELSQLSTRINYLQSSIASETTRRAIEKGNQNYEKLKLKTQLSKSKQEEINHVI